MKAKKATATPVTPPESATRLIAEAAPEPSNVRREAALAVEMLNDADLFLVNALRRAHDVFDDLSDVPPEFSKAIADARESFQDLTMALGCVRAHVSRIQKSIGEPAEEAVPKAAESFTKAEFRKEIDDENIDGILGEAETYLFDSLIDIDDESIHVEERALPKIVSAIRGIRWTRHLIEKLTDEAVKS